MDAISLIEHNPSLTPKMEVVCSAETLTSVHRITCCNNTGEHNFMITAVKTSKFVRNLFILYIKDVE
jgi:hypothetical protein